MTNPNFATLGSIVDVLESVAPLAFQESYDNSGLITGNRQQKVSAVLLCVDITTETLDEAIEKNCQLIISHHPPVFTALKKFSGSSPSEQIIVKAIENRIAIYSMHTNLDNYLHGMNAILCRKLGLRPLEILQPKEDMLCKLVTFCPTEHASNVREALFEAGAGHIGNYDSCSFNLQGEGTFRGNENTHPFVGQKGHLHTEPETRIETIFPSHLQKNVICALLTSHPYEEVAYDIYPLKNAFQQVGAGCLAQFDSPLSEEEFLKHIQKSLHIPVLRHSPLKGKPIQKVAICSGSGGFLLPMVLARKVDAYITSDLKYHDFQQAYQQVLLIDAGHYETEQFATEIVGDLLKEKFSNFALLFSTRSPLFVQYFI